MANGSAGSAMRRNARRAAGAARRAGRRGWRGWLFRLAWGLPLLFVLVTALQVLALRVIDPPTSAFMLDRQWQAFRAGEEDFELRYDWADWDALSPELPIALVAAEDQRFPVHTGFDLEAIDKALENNARGRPMRGASTITQQVAKNLFLWDGRRWLRKGLEAWYTLLIELLWPKQRILEVYANVAEFGDGIYGVEAAAQAYFGKPAKRLTAAESARLAAVLPNPKRYSARAGAVRAAPRRVDRAAGAEPRRAGVSRGLLRRSRCRSV